MSDRTSAPPQRRRHLVVVPVELALVYDAVRGWHYLPVPPAWWFEEQDRMLTVDAEALDA